MRRQAREACHLIIHDPHNPPRMFMVPAVEAMDPVPLLSSGCRRDRCCVVGAPGCGRRAPSVQCGDGASCGAGAKDQGFCVIESLEYSVNTYQNPQSELGSLNNRMLQHNCTTTRWPTTTTGSTGRPGADPLPVVARRRQQLLQGGAGQAPRRAGPGSGVSPLYDAPLRSTTGMCLCSAG